MLTDTHAHLYAEQFDNDRTEMLQRAFDAGVSRIFLPNIDQASISGMMALAEAYPEKIWPMIGLHPCSVNEDVEQDLAWVQSWLEKGKFVAVGEIGMDLYWDKTHIEQQKFALQQQTIWAKEKGLPVILHTREAFDEIFTVMDQLNDQQMRGIFHCFTGTVEQANHIIEYGDFYLGIGGVLTFKKSGLDQILKEIPLEYMVLETDAPYLSPTPHRGKRNESAYLTLVAEKLAEVKGVSVEEVARITTENSQKIFGI